MAPPTAPSSPSTAAAPRADTRHEPPQKPA